MNFKETFTKYKSGTATEQEAEFIKSEIEKHEIINDYLYEDLGNSLSDFSIEHEKEDEKSAVDFTKMIQKSIRKSFIKLGALVFLFLAILVLFIQFGLSPLIERFYYNPAKIAGEYNNQISLDMAIYTSLVLPLDKRDSVSVVNNGYGNYDIVINQTCSRDGDFTNVGGKITRNKLTLYDPNLLKKMPINAFAAYNNYSENQWAAGSQDDANQRLKSLNDNKLYKAYISFDKELSFNELKKFQKDNELYNMWCAVKTGDNNRFNGIHIGFNCTFSGYFLKGWDANKYPNLLTASSDDSSKISDENENKEGFMTTHVLSMLKYMIDQPEFLKMLNENGESFKGAYDYISENGIKSYGVVIYAEKNKLIKLSQCENVYGIYVPGNN